MSQDHKQIKWYCVAKKQWLLSRQVFQVVTVTTMEHSTTLVRTATGGVLKRSTGYGL